MQDRFKFRCWDDYNREMLDLQEQDTNPYNICDFTQNNIMQCTGLKDKNGKLIYEGDIVKFGTFYEEWQYSHIGKVYWGGEYSYPAFEIQCSTYDFDMCNGLSYIFGEGLSIEVIGNIYENIELLGVENE